MPRRIKTDSDNSKAVIFTDEENNSYCNLCDALLFEKRDGSMVCSNGYCAKTYSADTVTKHRSKLGPVKESGTSPEIVPLEVYHNPQKQKQKNILDSEDEKWSFFKRAGVSITSKEDFFPESE
jgi:hypothetical protein